MSTKQLLPPIQAKKALSSTYRPNTFRVLGEDAECHFSCLVNAPQSASAAGHGKETDILGADISRSTVEWRANRKNGFHKHEYAQFLHSDVKSLMNPICRVRGLTASDDYSERWWEHEASLQPTLVQTQYSRNSTSRADFPPQPHNTAPNTRHSANPNKTPAVGGAPVNLMPEADGTKRFWRESQSFDHDFNSRSPDYQVRGKRRGNFVWKRSHVDATRLNEFAAAGSELSCGGLCHAPEPCVDWRPAHLRQKFTDAEEREVERYQQCQHDDHAA